LLLRTAFKANPSWRIVGRAAPSIAVGKKNPKFIVATRDKIPKSPGIYDLMET
jgi:hypothetical protein